MANAVTSKSDLLPADKHTAEWLREIAIKMRKELPQVDVKTEHHFHAGVYSRTAFQPKGSFGVGACLRIPTQLVVSGKCRFFTDDGPVDVDGYKVFTGSANRMTCCLALEDTWMTSFWATSAKTIEEAEKEAVGEDAALLLSREQGD